MAAMPAVNINNLDPMIVTVRVVGLRQFKFRFWLMTLLIRVASFVAPRNVSVEVEDW